MPFSQLSLFYDTGKQDSCQSLRSSSFQARGTEPCHLPMPSEFQHPELPGNCARHRPIGGPGASWLRAMKTGVRPACHRPYRRSQRRLRQLCMRSTQGEPRSNPDRRPLPTTFQGVNKDVKHVYDFFRRNANEANQFFNWNSLFPDRVGNFDNVCNMLCLFVIVIFGFDNQEEPQQNET